MVRAAYKRVSGYLHAFFRLWVAEVSRTSQLALTTHPDKNPDNEGATQQFQQISEAYHALASHLDSSTHRHEYADPFDEYDDEDDDDDDGYFFYDLEDLQFYLWVVRHTSF